MDTFVSLNWKIAGRAGEGVMVTSEMFAKACLRHGLFVFNYYEYPSLIKGGHQTGQVFASNKSAMCQKRTLDLLIALNKDGLQLHSDQITADTIIIADSGGDSFSISDYQQLSKAVFALDFTRFSRELMGTSLAANTAAVGASAYMLGLDKTVFEELIRQQFAAKGDQVIDGNIKVFTRGYDEAAKLAQPKFHVEKSSPKGIMLNGGEAIGCGALAGGLQFFSAYPMSPSSNTFHYIAAQQDKFPLVVRHVEDEIAAINLAIGASYAGVRSMTGTAGGGYALMVEAMSLTGVMETPLVVLVAQRPGPATGLPTWTSQGDLQFVIRSGHGEFQKVVLTPGTVQEHFDLTKRAFELAEKYQIPVIILSDKYILESHQTMNVPEAQHHLSRYNMLSEDQLPQDDSYRRYQITDSGISPRSIPGQKHGTQLTNSYEHDEYGWATEDAQMTKLQVEKRDRKLLSLVNELPQPYVVGPQDADITFVCFGSTISVLTQLVSEQHDGPSVNVIHLPCMWPFPKEKFAELTQRAKRLVIVEGNHTGLAEQLIRQETGMTFSERIRRYDGRPFYTEDILEWIHSH